MDIFFSLKSDDLFCCRWIISSMRECMAKRSDITVSYIYSKQDFAQDRAICSWKSHRRICLSSSSICCTRRVYNDSNSSCKINLSLQYQEEEADCLKMDGPVHWCAYHERRLCGLVQDLILLFHTTNQESMEGSQKVSVLTYLVKKDYLFRL